MLLEIKLNYDLIERKYPFDKTNQYFVLFADQLNIVLIFRSVLQILLSSMMFISPNFFPFFLFFPLTEQIIRRRHLRAGWRWWQMQLTAAG